MSTAWWEDSSPIYFLTSMVLLLSPVAVGFAVFTVPHYGTARIVNCQEEWGAYSSPNPYWNCGNVSADSTLAGVAGQAEYGPLGVPSILPWFVIFGFLAWGLGPWYIALARKSSVEWVAVVSVGMAFAPWIGLKPSWGWLADSLLTLSLLILSAAQRSGGFRRDKVNQERDQERKEREDADRQSKWEEERAKERDRLWMNTAETMLVIACNLEVFTKGPELVLTGDEINETVEPASTIAPALWEMSEWVGEPLRQPLRIASENLKGVVKTNGLETRVALRVHSFTDGSSGKFRINTEEVSPAASDLSNILRQLSDRFRRIVEHGYDLKPPYSVEAVELNALSDSMGSFFIALSREVKDATSYGSGGIIGVRSVTRRARIQHKKWGAWEEIEELPRGGQGSVFLVSNRENGIGAVLKQPRRLSDSKARERFAREIKVMAKARHHNIIRILDWKDDPPYYVMERAEGNLGTIVRSFKGKPIKSLVTFLEICEGVSYAHEKLRVVHRDLKPANILFVDATPKVCDFGISLVIDEDIATKQETITGLVEPTGSRFFIAPECMWGSRVRPDVRADVWGLGKILHYMLSGGVSIPLDQFRRGREPITDLEVMFPRERALSRINILLSKMIVMDPEDRYKTVREVIRETTVALRDVIETTQGM